MIKFEVRWLDPKIDKDWAADPQHVLKCLFIRQDGRVMWHSFEGITDITDKVEITRM